jgi:hypothetical protein
MGKNQDPQHWKKVPVEVGIDGHMQVDDLELRSVVGLMMPEGGQSAKQLEQVTQRMGHLQIKDRI